MKCDVVVEVDVGLKLFRTPKVVLYLQRVWGKRDEKVN